MADHEGPRPLPENAEVDNTGRDFDTRKGMFTDEPGYDDAPERYTVEQEPPGSQRAAVDPSEASVGDVPPPMERGRSEHPPADGVGYDGTPVDQILREREERLANRPDNTEVDNT
ncbi:hypothetical protein [Nocardioides montaniterrae]